MKIFITGIAGFIGSNLARKLEQMPNTYVRGIDNLTTGKTANIYKNMSWKQVDIRDREKLEELIEPYDIVIHLAAQTSGEKSFEIPEYDCEVNILGSLNIYQFAKKCNAKLLINMSSMSVYGNVKEVGPVDENFRLEPLSLYGNSKLAAERMLCLMSEKDNLPVISFRLFNAYGENQNLDEMKQGMVSIYLAYLLGNEYDYIHVKGSMDRFRDFIYIDDIVSAILAVIESKKYESNVYNLSTAKAAEVKVLLEKMMQIAGIKKEVRSFGKTSGDINGFTGDNSKFKEAYGWSENYSLDQGLEKMVTFYKNRQI